MKKILTVILCLAMALSLFAGCMGMDEPMQSAMPNTDKNENNQTQKPENTDNNQQMQTTVDTSKLIGEDKAKEMALSKAGISAEGVVFDRVDLDLDDGVWAYEVEFRKDNVEYDVKVKADDGAILEYEKGAND